VGVGWTGSILARELAKAGLKVVGLERGPRRTPGEDFTIPSIRDDLKYAHRHELFQDTQTETVTLRHATSETALPMRRLSAFLPGTGLGGAGSHWNGLTWRLLPSDHVLRTHLIQRYGAKAIPEGMTIADYPITYDELEPYYDRFEKLCGVSGKAGNLGGRIIAGGNAFEGPRQAEYPNPPLARTVAGVTFDATTRTLAITRFRRPPAIRARRIPTPKA
jgi:gluconate 2-dehydrogenase alpha chain